MRRWLAKRPAIEMRPEPRQSFSSVDLMFAPGTPLWRGRHSEEIALEVVLAFLSVSCSPCLYMAKLLERICYGHRPRGRSTSSKCFVLLAIVVLNVACTSLEPLHPSSGMDLRIESTARESLPAIVSIELEGMPGTSQGAGIIIDAAQTLIVTNLHVVSRQRAFHVLNYRGDEIRGCKTLFTDRNLDLAALECRSSAPLSSALLIREDQVARPGQLVVSVGSNGGFGHSVSLGIIGAVNRPLKDGAPRIGYIQIDGALSRGSSGGAILDLDGNFLGLISRGNRASSVAFAIPAEYVKRFLQQGLRTPA